MFNFLKRIFNIVFLNNLILILILLFISTAEFRTINRLAVDNYTQLVEINKNILLGNSVWRAFQNRLLGSYTVKFLSFITGLPQDISYRLFMFLLILITNIVVYYLFLKIGRKKRDAILYTVVMASFFVAFQFRLAYSWDFYDMLFFSIFSYGIFTNKNLLFFITLFFIALANREDAVFIPVWLIINSFEYVKPDKVKIKIKRIKSFLWGIFLTLFGLAYTKILRDTLWANPGADVDHKTIGNHYVLMENFNMIRDGFSTSDIDAIATQIAVLTFICLVFIYLIKQMRNFTAFKVKVLVFFIVLFFVNMAFGKLCETRVYFILIPFLLMFDLYYRDDQQLISFIKMDFGKTGGNK